MTISSTAAVASSPQSSLQSAQQSQYLTALQNRTQIHGHLTTATGSIDVTV